MTTSEEGRCGDRGPILGSPGVCALPHGHGGWHRSDAGTEWNKTTAGLDLARLREVNTRRCARWHGPDTEPWSLADWSNAMCGEAGEAANVVKKIRRTQTGTDEHVTPGHRIRNTTALIERLATELADVVIYADLVAANAGIDLSRAIVDKFNAVSVREGFPERIQ